jgi:hypothetical protein
MRLSHLPELMQRNSSSKLMAELSLSRELNRRKSFVDNFMAQRKSSTFGNKWDNLPIRYNPCLILGLLEEPPILTVDPEYNFVHEEFCDFLLVVKSVILEEINNLDRGFRVCARVDGHIISITDHTKGLNAFATHKAQNS